MAGDVAISAEILEFIVDYITKENQDEAHSSTEVKVRELLVCYFKNVDLYPKCEVQMYVNIRVLTKLLLVNEQRSE